MSYCCLYADVLKACPVCDYRVRVGGSFLSFSMSNLALKWRLAWYDRRTSSASILAACLRFNIRQSIEVEPYPCAHASIQSIRTSSHRGFLHPSHLLTHRRIHKATQVVWLYDRSSRPVPRGKVTDYPCHDLRRALRFDDFLLDFAIGDMGPHPHPRPDDARPVVDRRALCAHRVVCGHPELQHALPPPRSSIRGAPRWLDDTPKRQYGVSR